MVLSQDGMSGMDVKAARLSTCASVHHGVETNSGARNCNEMFLSRGRWSLQVRCELFCLTESPFFGAGGGRNDAPPVVVHAKADIELFRLPRPPSILILR